MKVSMCIAVAIIAGCTVPSVNGLPGKGSYLMTFSGLAHQIEAYHHAARAEGKAIFGGGEGCLLRVNLAFVERLEAFADAGTPIASVDGLAWKSYHHTDPTPRLGYFAIITGPETGRVGFTDAGSLETRDGRLVMLDPPQQQQLFGLLSDKVERASCPWKS